MADTPAAFPAPTPAAPNGFGSSWQESWVKAYIDLKVISEREYANLRFESSEEALKLARESMGLRLERMNEFREQIEKERGDYARRETVDGRFLSIDKEMAQTKGRDLGVIALVVGIISAIISAIISVVVRLVSG